MGDEPTDEELRELGAPPRVSKKSIVLAVLAGTIAAIVLVLAAYFAP